MTNTEQPEHSRNAADEEHGEEALEEAEDRMLLHDEGEASEHDGTGAGLGGEHDESALKEAEEKMLLRDDRT